MFQKAHCIDDYGNKYTHIYKICNETSAMIGKYKKFLSKLIPCIHLLTRLMRSLYTKIPNNEGIKVVETNVKRKNIFTIVLTKLL